MAAAIELKSDYSADELRTLAKASRDAKQTRRLLALASIYEGGSRTVAARIGGVGLQIVRDWVVRFNAEGPAGLLDRKAPGKAPRLAPAQLAALARAVEAGPKPYLDGVVRWRLGDLAAWLREEFGVSVSETTVSRALKRLGFRVLSARPQAHGQDPEAMEAFKKTSPRSWQKYASGMPRGGASRSGSRTRRESARRT
jgi:transposase